MPKSYQKNRKNARQVLLFKKVMQNGGRLTQAMRELGYSPGYINNSKNLIKTKSWQSLMEDYLSDNVLAVVHGELLRNKDWRARDSALDKAYKLKKYYGSQLDLNVRLGALSDREVEDAIAREVSEVVGVIAREGQKTEE